MIKADTIQFVFDYDKDNEYNTLQFDIVAVANGTENHSGYNFHTYDWNYDYKLATKTTGQDPVNGKEWFIYSVDLKRVKEMMGNNKTARILLRTKWYNVMPQNTNVQYTVKLLANGETRYTRQNSINLLTYEYFPIDVFYRKIFEVAYNAKNDSIVLLNNSEPDKSATFEFDMVLKKNEKILYNQHLITKSLYSQVMLYSLDFKKGDKFTCEVSNFKINLSYLNPTVPTKVIIPDFTSQKQKDSVTENGCKFSILNADLDYYSCQIDFLDDIQDPNTSSKNIMTNSFPVVMSPYTICYFGVHYEEKYHSTLRYYDVGRKLQSVELFS